MEEIWKDIEGYDGLYQVSNMGRVRSFRFGGRNKKGFHEDKVTSIYRILSLNGASPYLYVNLAKGGQHKTFRVHRLVAKAFIPNPDNLPQVNHIDANKRNNTAENLEWCTSQHNVLHAMKARPSMLNGIMYYNKVLRPKRIAQIDRRSRKIIAIFRTAHEAGVKTGVCARNILQVANRTPFSKKGQIRKTAGGYIWRFESEVMPNGG